MVAQELLEGTEELPARVVAAGGELDEHRVGPRVERRADLGRRARSPTQLPHRVRRHGGVDLDAGEQSDHECRVAQALADGTERSRAERRQRRHDHRVLERLLDVGRHRSRPSVQCRVGEHRQVGTLLAQAACEFLVGVEIRQRVGRHRPGHGLAEPRLVLRRVVPRLVFVRRDLVTLVEERRVDHLGRRAGHAGPEHAGQRERVVRIAAEHLEQIGQRRILELVVVERADGDVGVAQAGAHPLAHHEGLAERAERIGEHIGGVPAGPRREPFAEFGVAEPGVVSAQDLPPRRWPSGPSCRPCPSGCAGSPRRR